ncbi:glycosyl hydrolase family 28-related protein [Pelagicoccus sp. SDUM812002]|uniref:glycosyl hydrolase family 28-related protein n=1 Tax=Pelagicoccus sp. SDUM812002 TaxID=3041266 RepID=UPI00280FB8D9|nr:glycosyl hydrolase family 28-related protein [Pelagicoccus sp. SDUM812002]MDQ8186278.1 glycosyl hydrolase family 28-related protein [Pelagicoccus sp. SDUM812002]
MKISKNTEVRGVLSRRRFGQLLAGVLLPSIASERSMVASEGGSETSEGSWVNVKAYGVKGDGVVDDTFALVRAVKAAKGRPVFFEPGKYLISYLQLSGDPSEPHFIDSNALTIVGRGQVEIISKSFVGERPPKSLGVKYGFTASALSLHGFTRISIQGLTFIGPLFRNIIEDVKPLVEGRGTYNAYNTRTKAISVNFSENVTIQDVLSRQHYGGIYLRECSDSVVKNVEHRESRQSYLFQDCDNLVVRNAKSYHARFTLDNVPNAYADGKVYERSGTALIYTIAPEATGGKTGVKRVSGYGFIVAGCRNSTLANCYSYAAGSDCFRVQNGPTGRQSVSVSFIDCVSDTGARHGFSVYAGNCLRTTFKRCVVTGLADIDFYNAQPPTTLTEARNPVVNADSIHSFWAFRLNRSINTALYHQGIDTVFEECSVKSKDDLKVKDFSKLSLRFMKAHDAYGPQCLYQDHGATNGVVTGCVFAGQVESRSGMIQFMGGRSIKFEGNSVSTSTGRSRATSTVCIIGLRSDYSSLELVSNSLEGGMYSVYMVNTSGTYSIEGFVSSNNVFLNPGISVFRVVLATHVYNLTSLGDTFQGPALCSTLSGGKLQGILFRNPTLRVSSIGFNTADESEMIRFRHSDEGQGSK